jgi:GxxExxY protein
VKENELCTKIIVAAIEVHRSLGGPGLLERVYEEALVWELNMKGISVARQVELPIVYKGNKLGTPLRLDLLVEDLLIVEIKALTTYNPIFEAQLLTYLKLANLRLGLVINFGERLLKDGIHRVVNGL